MSVVSLQQSLFVEIIRKFTLAIAFGGTVCSQLLAQQTPLPPPPNGFGVGLPGITAAQLSDWQAGKIQFQAKMSPTEGLGPIFNGASCVECHSGPAIGGSSHINATRFGLSSASSFDPLTNLGGSLLQTKALNPADVEVIPSQANVVAHRNTQPLFGLGLIEAIPAASILTGVRTIPVNGVLGRAAMVTDPVTGTLVVGRFGWKAQQPTLLAFAADAFVNEMGITNRIYRNENAPNGNSKLLAAMQPKNVPTPNDQPNPATGKSGIDRLTDFMRFTAPPPKQPTTPTTIAGGNLFTTIGCADCHTPVMSTGVNTQISAFNKQSVALYSDLLLHDMGSLGDGIGQGAAKPTEMRTAPLWGLSASAPYLHDGRAETVDAAIRAHTGEGTHAATQYLKLTSSQQQQLLAFLNSL